MLSVALRLLACSVATYAAWLVAGPVGIVWCAPLYGAALARPLIEATTSAYGLMRALAYRDVEGRHCAYQGISINVAEDAEGHQWLRLSDVRKVLPDLSRDEWLRKNFGTGVGPVAPDRSVRIQAEVLVTHLGRTTSPDTAKFTRWIERTVVYPSRKRRERRDTCDEHAR